MASYAVRTLADTVVFYVPTFTRVPMLLAQVHGRAPLDVAGLVSLLTSRIVEHFWG